MATYKFTVKYGGHGFGPTESFYMVPTDTDSLVNTLNNYMRLRKSMLFSDYEITGIRIGLSSLSSAPGPAQDAVRASNFYPAGEDYAFPGTAVRLIVPNTGSYLPPAGSHGASFANISINERVRFNDTRYTTRYIPFCPAVDIGSDKPGGNLGTDTKWFDLLAAQQLMWEGKGIGDFTGSPFYVRAIARTAGGTPRNIVKWILASPGGGNIGAVVSNADASGYAFGQKVFIHGTRRRPLPVVGGAIKLQSINGHWRVDAIQPDSPVGGQTSIFLQNTAGIDVSTIKTAGTIAQELYAVFPVQDAQAVRVRTRKRGKDTTVPAGRHSTRTTADG
jgi:hypothetical protein